MALQFTDKKAKALLKAGKVGKYSAGNGLYFKVSNEGNAFWIVRYNIRNKRREITLGSYPVMSLADANTETALLKNKLKNNVDPLVERQREDNEPLKTVDDLAEDWLKECDRRLKHSNIPRRVYTKDISPIIGELEIEQVSPRDIRTIIIKIKDSGRPSISNDALMYCKQLFRHGIKLDLTRYNPADAFSVNDAGGVEQSRSRVLSFEELKIIFSCFQENNESFVRENYLAVALLVTLGIRKGELVSAKWEEFDLDASLWHMPEEKSKTGVAITIPLPYETIEWFQELYVRSNGSEFVFPRRRASKRFGHMSPDTINVALQNLRKSKKLKIDHFTLHDLRRTCRSMLASEGIPGHIAERCLNHKIKGVEGIYDRYDYLEERREALQKIATKLATII
ncbi:MAG: site-specific integrase [Cellulophaga sp.]